MDFMLDRLGTTGSKTAPNDVVIGMLGAIAVFFFLSASHDKENSLECSRRSGDIGGRRKAIDSGRNTAAFVRYVGETKTHFDST
jgi:hypothetical protein